MKKIINIETKTVTRFEITAEEIEELIIKKYKLSNDDVDIDFKVSGNYFHGANVRVTIIENDQKEIEE